MLFLPLSFIALGQCLALQRTTRRYSTCDKSEIRDRLRKSVHDLASSCMAEPTSNFDFTRPIENYRLGGRLDQCEGCKKKVFEFYFSTDQYWDDFEPVAQEMMQKQRSRQRCSLHKTHRYVHSKIDRLWAFREAPSWHLSGLIITDQVISPPSLNQLWNTKVFFFRFDSEFRKRGRNFESQLRVRCAQQCSEVKCKKLH